MFIGHYALGFAGKKIYKAPSLGTMFMAVQWLDLVWPLLVLSGVEKVNIEPGNTVFTPLNFVSYPWSHSMLMAIIWGILFATVYYIKTKNRNASVFLLFLVFSHWILDWISHRPDLQLAPFSEIRVGLGLWNNKWATLIIETLLFIIGIIMYLNATKAKNKTGVGSLWGLVVFLLIIYFMNAFGPPPDNVQMIAWVGNAQWLLVAWGYWIDRNRI
ncbi:MAG: metal-dependent hydrolase [Bacteroidia bacterium]|nr:metal-dependent hydrolase [Bacteroidia bacterium]